MIGRWTLARQVVPDLVGAVRAVEQERRAVLGHAQHVGPLEQAELVAGHEVGALDQVRGADRRGPKRRWETVVEPDFFES